MLRRISLLILMQILCTCIAQQAPKECGGILITHYEDLQLLRNCDVIVGAVQIVNVNFEPHNDNISSNVADITDYVLLHRTTGLKSLHQIFPKLQLIRGLSLLFDEYALVVFENRDLMELGLESLIRVQLGAIRIEMNPMLCFVETVNWVQLLHNSTRQHFILKHNRSPNQCPFCHNCWSMTMKQREIAYSKTNCTGSCSVRGCNERGACCDSHCLSGCASEPCTLCNNIQFGLECVNACKEPYLLYNKRGCISSRECGSLYFVSHNGVCVEHCPPNHLAIENTRTRVSVCEMICANNFVIHTSKDLVDLERCTHIVGSVTIELQDLKSRIVSDLEHAFKNVVNITGYLKVTNSPQLVSLNFLPRLQSLGKDFLVFHQYALWVVGNHNLEKIWAPNHTVTLVNGRMYFQLNPRLCYSEIEALRSSLRGEEDLLYDDASMTSNGERVVCDSNRQINLTIEEFNATMARIKLSPVSADDKEALIGYVYFYKEAPFQNITKYDGLHGCGRDDWLYDIALSRNVRYMLKNLRPNTQYAVFVKALTKKHYLQYQAYSDIKYFRTLPSEPGPVAKIYFRPISSTELIVHWWPPRAPNGSLKKYIVKYTKVDNENKTHTKKDETYQETTDLDCECVQRDPFNSGPIPDEEDYYQREQVTYDEAVLDLIFVARSHDDEPKKDKQDATKQRKRRSAQEDTSFDHLQILAPLMPCEDPNATPQFQMANACIAEKKYNGTTVPRDQHQHTLSGLEQNTTYLITVRACVSFYNIALCGPERGIYAEPLEVSSEKQ